MTLCETCQGSGAIKWSKEGGGPLDFFMDECPMCDGTGDVIIIPKMYPDEKEV